MATGTISKIIVDKGFGFIRADGESGERFFHRSAVRGSAMFEMLREGQQVVFDATQGDKGPRAENVEVGR